MSTRYPLRRQQPRQVAHPRKTRRRSRLSYASRAAALEREHRGAVEAMAREADHLAALRAASVGRLRGEIEEDIDGVYEERMGD